MSKTQNIAAQPRIELNSEPFRLMFPAGILAGMLGVLLWPLYVWADLPFYPGLAHGRIMIGGFFGAMILGFLGTAGPRMLGVRALANWQMWTLFGLWAAATLSAATNHIALADGLSVLVFITGFCIAGRRFAHRQDLPPAGFAMVILGLFSGLVGALLNLAVSLEAAWLPQPFVMALLGKLLFYQAFILLPILGVAPFFFPRFGGLPNPAAAFPDSPYPTPEWTRRAVLSVACGGVLIASYLIEAWGHAKIAAVMRAAFAVGFIVWQIPLRYKKGQVGTLGRVVQIGVVLLIFGLAAPGIWGQYRLALLHFLFIGGFNLITLSVANWVIFAHGGSGQRLRGKLVYARWAFGIILFALATRISADVFKEVYDSHLAYAALAWVVGTFIWAWNVLPRVSKAD